MQSAGGLATAFHIEARFIWPGARASIWQWQHDQALRYPGPPDAINGKASSALLLILENWCRYIARDQHRVSLSSIMAAAMLGFTLRVVLGRVPGTGTFPELGAGARV